MEIKYKIWIEKDGRVVFGKGRDAILTSIQDTRSLNAAAKKLKMSYRAAWGRLKASEERTGMKLVEVDSTEKGMHLTPQAKAIMDRCGECYPIRDGISCRACQCESPYMEGLETPALIGKGPNFTGNGAV